jgi:endonuclease/exonuclease/phosphatase family metal-dependent hydrolase
MRIARKHLLFCLLALPLGAAVAWPNREPRTDVITIASWNLEWLVTPTTAHASRLACRNHRRSELPCDVVQDLARDSADLARLAAYTRKLDADVIAFQEVENEAIARRVFSGYRICIADGPGLQHAGFAVRPHLAHRCGPSVDSLAIDGRSRKGMTMLLTPAHGPPVELLVVHLKSGCSRDALDSGSIACRMLGKQAEYLGKWIAEHEPRARFIVLGDFNRVSPQSPDDTFWQQVQSAPTTLLAASLPFRNCFAGQPYSAYIDHMLLSNTLEKQPIYSTGRHFGYRNADVLRYRLSDHCPISISLTLADMT